MATGNKRMQALVACLVGFLILAIKTLADTGPNLQAIAESFGDTARSVLEAAFAAVVTFLVLLFYEWIRRPSASALGPAGDLLHSRSEHDAPEVVTSLEEEHLSASMFIGRADMTSVSRIDIMSITGEVTIRPICETLEALEAIHDNNISLRILLRADSSSDARRIDSKRGTRESLRRLKKYMPNLKYELRDFSTVSPLSCVVLTHNNGLYSAHLTFFDWHNSGRMTGRESHTNWCYVRQNVESDKLLSVFQSWFERLWGKHKIHTLVFDFDDTLFRTSDLAVNAWVTTILQARASGWIGDDEFSPEIRPAMGNSATLFEVLKRIYLDDGEEREVLQRVFARRPSDDRLKLFRDIRMAAREQATRDEATPVPELTTHLSQLIEEYQLVVISATSENTIKFVLDKHKLDYFAYIFGRDIENVWRDTETKTHHFVRASNMIGAPLERMALIGDSESDYRVARQLGLAFIETRVCTSASGRESLVRSRSEGERGIVIGGHGGLDLLTALNTLEGELAARIAAL